VAAAVGVLHGPDAYLGVNGGGFRAGVAKQLLDEFKIQKVKIQKVRLFVRIWLFVRIFFIDRYEAMPTY
jgi:hypothetical protein